MALAFCAMFAPIAHVLEMPNKLQLDRQLWLAVQQTLFRGWGPFIGAPTEIGALALSIMARLLYSKDSGVRWLWLHSACVYIGMIIVFFVLNSPVNTAVAGWHRDTLPADWTSYRARWELGHGLAAIFSCIGLKANRFGS